MPGQGKLHLVVLANGQEMGDLYRDEHGRAMTFRYRDRWRSDRSATPLSLSMPLARQEHPHATVEPFLRGLLPDNEEVLKRWGLRYGVSWQNPFALLSHVGEDVAGAVQFVREDRLDQARAPGGIEPVDEKYIANRLRVLRTDRAAWTDTRGEFSLAGAQSKFALYRADDGTWGIPTGKRATTHILKPSLPDLADQEVNEHLCLRAASLLGLPAARSQAMTFEDEPAIVLERYDRYVDPATGEVTRIHQEDICQALAVDPSQKYERIDRGPGAKEILALFREHQAPRVAKESIERFCRALAFNWVIYAPDAHAKNYSLLLAGPEVRLAPLYDISSVLPYPTQFDLGDMAMAMSVNRKYQNNLVFSEDWRALATSNKVDPDEMYEWVWDIASRAPDAFKDAVASERPWVSALWVASKLVDAVAATSSDLLRWYTHPSAAVNIGIGKRLGDAAGRLGPSTVCQVCGSPLSNPKSVARGTGPTCAAKREASRP